MGIVSSYLQKDKDRDPTLLTISIQISHITHAALERKEGTSIQPLEKPTATPPPPHTSPEKEVDSQKDIVSAPLQNCVYEHG